MYVQMNLKDMNYILEQAGSMANAMTNILEALNTNVTDEGRAVYVDCKNEINFVGQEEAEEVIDCFGENCEIEMIGNTDFAILYNVDDKVSIAGESYLLGEYIVMRREEDVLVPLFIDDMEEFENAYSSRLVTFVIGEDQTEVYQL